MYNEKSREVCLGIFSRDALKEFVPQSYTLLVLKYREFPVMAVGAATVRSHVGHEHDPPGESLPKRHARSVDVECLHFIEVASNGCVGRRRRV